MSTPPPRGPRAPNPLRLLLGAFLVTAVDALLLALALGGAAALLGHPRALALLALWGGGSIALALLRPVRDRDPVEEQPEHRVLLLALLLVPLLTPAIAAWGERVGLWPLPGGPALRWAGVALSGIGLAVRIAAMAQLGARFSPIAALQRGHALETRGLYARMRHPGYLGSCLATLGAALAFGSALGLPWVLAMALLIGARTRREEALLERHFGDEYRRYRARTGRYFPRMGGLRQKS